MTSENRELTRVPPHLDVLVEARGEILVGQTQDICLKGTYVVCEQKLAANTVCKITIHLGGGQAGLARAQVEAYATVVRADDRGMALFFTDLIGLESFEHLKNLILYNAEYTEKIEKELESYIGLNPR